MSPESSAHSRVWNGVQTVISGLLVASVIGLVADRFNTGRDMERHGLLIDQLIEWKGKGDRFTATDGAKLTQHFDNEITRLEVGCRERSEKALSNDIRQWDAHRKHIDEAAHKGAQYQINSVKDMVNQCCRLERR